MELEHKILSADSASLTVQVQFLNPYYTGEFITTEEYEETVEDGEEPVKKTREVDNDPNPHAVKNVNVPVKNGKVDKEAFNLILEQQALGVKSRMEAAYQMQQKPVNLNKAFGL
jgi:hypothetical protein